MTQDVRRHIEDVLDRARRLHGKGETTSELGAELATALRMCGDADDVYLTASVHYALATHEMISMRLDAAVEQCEAGLALIKGTQTQLEVDLLVLLSRQYIANNVIKAKEITTNAMALSKHVNGHPSPSVLLRHAEAIGANGDVDGSIALLRQAEALYGSVCNSSTTVSSRSLSNTLPK
jgi:hypothetical protein